MHMWGLVFNTEIKLCAMLEDLKKINHLFYKFPYVLSCVEKFSLLKIGVFRHFSKGSS